MDTQLFLIKQQMTIKYFTQLVVYLLQKVT